MPMMKKIDSQSRWLVTGGAGFIGSHFVRDSLNTIADLGVINLDAQTYAACPLTLSDVTTTNYQLVSGDIADEQLVESVLRHHQPNAIVHFAAESHVDRSIDAPDVFLQTNVTGTLKLLQRATDYWLSLDKERQATFRFLHVSTDEVYGSLDDTGSFDETSPYRPNSPYAASKAASDHLVRAWHHTYGLPTLISHCSNNYGSYQYPEKLIPLIILKALNGEPLPVYGDGRQIRDWLHVSDHVRALWSALAGGQPGQTYTIGGNNEQANIDVVGRICILLDQLRPQATSYCERIEHVADRPGHDRRYAINAERAHKELGWQPEVDFDQGLRQTVVWYLENHEWVQAAQKAYQGQRLGRLSCH